jgi:hypothetical protein
MHQAAADAAAYQPAAGSSCSSSTSQCMAGLAKLVNMADKYGLEEQHVSNICETHQMTFVKKKDGPVWIKDLKKASMQFVLCHMAASMQEVNRLGLQQQPAAAAGAKVQHWGQKALSFQERQQ